MKDLNCNNNAKLDVFRTLKVIINSLLFNIYYFLLFINFRNWKFNKKKINELDDINMNLLKIKMIGSNHIRRKD